MAKKERIQELYYLRAIAALGILIIHATGGFAVRSEYGSKAMYVGIFLNQFFRYGSPIFMMVSGLVLFYNYRTLDDMRPQKFYIKKLKFIVLPYILWSIIYFLYTSYMHNIPLTGFRIKNLFKNILVGSGYSHLYFIFLISQFYILLPLMIIYLVKPMEEKPFKVFFTFLLIQSIVLFYGYYFRNPEATGFVGVFNKYYWKTFPAWCFYFVTGGLMGVHYKKVVNFIEKHIKGIFIGFLITTIFYVGQVYRTIRISGGRDCYGKFGSIRPQTMIYALFSMAMLLWTTRRIVERDFKLKRLIRNFGTYSMGVYFLHPLVLEHIKIRFKGVFPKFFGYSRLSSLLLLVMLGILATYAIVLLISMLNIRWMFVGKVPKITFPRKSKTTSNL